MTTLPTSEILHRAADLIEERGWWRGGNSEGRGTCAANALLSAGGGYFNAGHEALLKYLTGSRCTPIRAIFDWNDSRSDASDVIEVLRATAVIEAAKESSPARDQAGAVA